MIFFDLRGMKKLCKPLIEGSKYHSTIDYDLYYRLEIKPYLEAGKFHLWLDSNNNAKALVTYAFLSDDILAGVTSNYKASLRLSDFDTGQNLYISDLVAKSNGKKIIQELRETIFPYHVGHFVRRHPDTTIRLVSKIYGKKSERYQ